MIDCGRSIYSISVTGIGCFYKNLLTHLYWWRIVRRFWTLFYVQCTIHVPFRTSRETQRKLLITVKDFGIRKSIRCNRGTWSARCIRLFNSFTYIHCRSLYSWSLLNSPPIILQPLRFSVRRLPVIASGIPWRLNHKSQQKTRSWINIVLYLHMKRLPQSWNFF